MNSTLIILILFVVILNNACVPTQQLLDDEYLLYSQKIKGNEQFSDELLEAFTHQKPNRKIAYLPISPYLYFHDVGSKIHAKRYSKDSVSLIEIKATYAQKIKELQGQVDSLEKTPKTNDLSKSNTNTFRITRQIQDLIKKRNNKVEKLERRLREGNWLMRVVGEAPTIYNPALTDAALQSMKVFMRQNGYFSVQASAKEDTVGKYIMLSYIISENRPHTIRNLNIAVEDSNLYNTVAAYVRSLEEPKSGKIYTQESLENLRLGLGSYLKDRGYFDFNKSYIFFEVDTNQMNFQVDIGLIIKNPPNDSTHAKYRISEVVFDTDAGIRKQKQKADTTFYKKVSYIEKRRKYNKKLLSDLISIQKDSLYSTSSTRATQNTLARLEHFKFVNINYEKRNNNRLKASIFSSHYDKHQFSAEGGLNIAQTLPGPFFNLSLKTRNFFGGFEIFEFSTRFAIEAQSSTTEIEGITSRQYGGNLSLTFPKVLFPLPLKFRRKIYIRSPRTKLQVGLSYIDRPEYSRVNAQVSIEYQWRNKVNESFELKLWEVNLVDTRRISEDFETRLVNLSNQGNNLILGFNNSIVSGTSVAYNRNRTFPKAVGNRSNFLLLKVEWGGGIASLLNRVFAESTDVLFGLRYYQFLRLSADWRVAHSVTHNSQIAMRLAGGIIGSTNGTGAALPYEKYFFSGGSYSNRGWQARRIGPGAFQPNVGRDGFFEYNFEQPGEINIEYNIEFRSRLASVLYGAIFLDASNTWTIKEDNSRPGAVFLLSDFWKQFAISVGVGLRFDLSFLIIRLDWAAKMYDPARPEGFRFIGNKILSNFPNGEKGQTLINIGIGYPF